MATTSSPPINDKKEIFGWAMYDWANSAFSTTIGTVFLGPYIASLAAVAAEASPDGLARFFGLPVAPDSVVPFGVAFSVVFQAGFLPILGAIADYSHRRKQMMQLFATIGGLATTLLFFVTQSNWWLGPVLLGLWLFAMVASVGSFLNVVIYRLPDGLNLIHPGSRCPADQHRLANPIRLPAALARNLRRARALSRHGLPSGQLALPRTDHRSR